MKKILLGLILSVNILFGYANVGLFDTVVTDNTTSGFNISHPTKTIGVGSRSMSQLTTSLKSTSNIYISTNETHALYFEGVSAWTTDSQGNTYEARFFIYDSILKQHYNITIGDNTYTGRMYEGGSNDGSSRLGSMTVQLFNSTPSNFASGDFTTVVNYNIVMNGVSKPATITFNGTAEEFTNITFGSPNSNSTLGLGIEDYTEDIGTKTEDYIKTEWEIIPIYVNSNSEGSISISASNSYFIDNNSVQRDSKVMINTGGSDYYLGMGASSYTQTLWNGGMVEGTTSIGDLKIKHLKDTTTDILPAGSSTTITTIEVTMN